MKPELDATTTYYSTYEEREQAFGQSVFSLIPRKYSGPRLFWQDFGRISRTPVPGGVTAPVAYITGNPRDSLVYGTPGQALAAARMCARGAGAPGGPDVAQVARRFALEDNLQQPVKTLSGGETVKVAMAKAFVAADYCQGLIVASPFTWLSQANRVLFHDLVARYRQNGLPVTVLALEGEDSTAPLPAAALPAGLYRREIDFDMLFSGLKIRLTTSVNPLYRADRHVAVADFEDRLSSPCLLLGENGQGKSLIAKSLAGAVPCEGECRAGGRELDGPARLLFQDVVGQTLLRNFDTIRATAGGGRRSEFGRIYQKIMSSITSSVPPALRRPPGRNGRSDFRSLLEMKAALVAVRLCGRPGALILDEPDWGLSRPTAIAFVFGAIAAAHQKGVPVLLISHKPWWLNAAGSALQVRRSDRVRGEAGAPAFTISIAPAGRNIP